MSGVTDLGDISLESFQAGDILGPALNFSCKRIAARINLASCPRSAVICNPRGRPLASGMGIEIAGVPSAVHGAFILGSPVVDRPRGAAPGAAGVRITGVDLNISDSRALESEMNRFVSSYFSTGILRPSRVRSAIGC